MHAIEPLLLKQPQKEDSNNSMTETEQNVKSLKCIECNAVFSTSNAHLLSLLHAADCALKRKSKQENLKEENKINVTTSIETNYPNKESSKDELKSSLKPEKVVVPIPAPLKKFIQYSDSNDQSANDSKPYQCQICESMFKNLKIAFMHIQKHEAFQKERSKIFKPNTKQTARKSTNNYNPLKQQSTEKLKQNLQNNDKTKKVTKSKEVLTLKNTKESGSQQNPMKYNEQNKSKVDKHKNDDPTKESTSKKSQQVEKNNLGTNLQTDDEILEPITAILMEQNISIIDNQNNEDEIQSLNDVDIEIENNLSKEKYSLENQQQCTTLESDKNINDNTEEIVNKVNKLKKTEQDVEKIVNKNKTSSVNESSLASASQNNATTHKSSVTVEKVLQENDLSKQHKLQSKDNPIKNGQKESTKLNMSNTTLQKEKKFPKIKFVQQKNSSKKMKPKSVSGKSSKKDAEKGVEKFAKKGIKNTPQEIAKSKENSKSKPKVTTNVTSIEKNLATKQPTLESSSQENNIEKPDEEILSDNFSSNSMSSWMDQCNYNSTLEAKKKAKRSVSLSKSTEVQNGTTDVQKLAVKRHSSDLNIPVRKKTARKSIRSRPSTSLLQTNQNNSVLPPCVDSLTPRSSLNSLTTDKLNKPTRSWESCLESITLPITESTESTTSNISPKKKPTARKTAKSKR